MKKLDIRPATSLSGLYTHREIHKNYHEMRKTKSAKKCSGVFRVTFFAFHSPFFAFHISHQGRHLHKKSKDFVVYFFAALIKHEICIKYKKCIVRVSYLVVCFAKYLQNAKYEKCIAHLRISQYIGINFSGMFYPFPFEGNGIYSPSIYKGFSQRGVCVYWGTYNEQRRGTGHQ